MQSRVKSFLLSCESFCQFFQKWLMGRSKQASLLLDSTGEGKFKRVEIFLNIAVPADELAKYWLKG